MSLLSSRGSGSSSLKVVALGAGQDVGRSCMVVTVGGKNVMLDCGMHMGYRDERRFPDFAYLSASATAPDSSGMPAGGSSGDPPAAFDGVIDAVLISHFHLDHCGALPYFSEMFGCVYHLSRFSFFFFCFFFNFFFFSNLFFPLFCSVTMVQFI